MEYLPDELCEFVGEAKVFKQIGLEVGAVHVKESGEGYCLD